MNYCYNNFNKFIVTWNEYNTSMYKPAQIENLDWIAEKKKIIQFGCQPHHVGKDMTYKIDQPDLTGTI